METNKTSGSSKCGGMLLAAFQAGQTEEITWTEIKLGDLVITVAKDAMKAPVGDRTGVRLPVSYLEAATICRALGCIAPTQPICDAIFAQAKPQLSFVPLVRTAADSAKMTTVEFALRFNDGVEKQLAGCPPNDRALLFGAWKLWILHKRIAERGAVNYGFWDKSKKPPKPIQSVGGQHDARHYDYSQLLQPIKRMARNAVTGEEVDLVDYFASHDLVPAKHLSPYKGEPGALSPLSFEEPEEAEVDLVQTLTAAGIKVAPADGWEKRGGAGFNPQGIMVHDTAGPKKGDVPSLQQCINGRADLPGPLCNIVVSRNGTAHIVAASTASHACEGAEEVLDLVRKDQPVEDSAKENNYKDATSGDAHFYGIQVENAGTPDDPYPEAQIEALGGICAALCQAHGWTASRVVLARQWSTRKVGMAFRGDLPGIVAQKMDTGTIHFGMSFGSGEAPRISRAAPKGKNDDAMKAKKTAARKAKRAARSKVNRKH